MSNNNWGGRHTTGGNDSQKIKDSIQKEKVERFKRQGQRYKIDMRPRVFMRKMRLELILFGFGMTCALLMPYYMRSISRKRHENRKLDLEEAFGNANSNMKSRYFDQGAVLRVAENDQRRVVMNEHDENMDDFMREVHAVDSIARENYRETAGQGLR